MKQTKPYELLVRFNIDGSVSGAHIKAQSYYMDGAAIDLGTWREEQATPADLASPELTALFNKCALSLASQVNEANAALADALAEADQLRAALDAANAAAEAAAEG